MNEIEKAINDLDNLRSCESISSNHFKEVHGNNLELAISALEKQIPKKPILMQLSEPEYMCECGMKYWRKGGVKYCIECGQAIDWSVEE